MDGYDACMEYAMHSNRHPWSVGLGSWAGIEVRMHGSVFFGALAILYIAWQEWGAREQGLVAGTACLLMTWLLSSVVHEVAHAMAIDAQGQQLEMVVFGPLGGGHVVRGSDPVPRSLSVHLSGIMATLALFLVACAGMRLREWVPLTSMLFPRSLSELVGAGQPDPFPAAAIRSLAFVNGWITLVNLIPAFPFDGAAVCMSFLRKRRPHWDHRRAVLWMGICSRGVALVLFLASVLFVSTAPTLLPSWFVLSGLALTVFFAARVEERRLHELREEDELFGYDFSQGYTSLEKPSTSPRPPKVGWIRRTQLVIRRRWQMRRARKEAAEEREVDAILARLHEHGRAGLTARERSILRRASHRYRNRLSS